MNSTSGYTCTTEWNFIHHLVQLMTSQRVSIINDSRKGLVHNGEYCVLYTFFANDTPKIFICYIIIHVLLDTCSGYVYFPNTDV